MFNLLLTIIYISFISLGLPDSLLGSAWPVMQLEMNAPVSYAGIISMIISLGTIISSLMSDKMVRKFGAGKITAVSIAMTAAALLGFSFSSRLWMLFVWAVPYGLGAGCVDSVLNNYVALHYKSSHMSWLHCMWGVGASISPYIMSFSIISLDSWNYGYLIVAIIQIVLSALVFMSLPKWKAADVDCENKDGKSASKPMKFREIFRIPGVLACFLTFFGYCALELTVSLWASSYLVDGRGIAPEIASGYASLYYIGVTSGRAVNGFLAMKFNDRFLIRLGLGVIFVGIILILMQGSTMFALVGFVVCGLGCAPIYPCIIHMTPTLFGKERSQSIIGVQIACAYCGFCIMPPLFGVIADFLSASILPMCLMILLILVIVMHETVVMKTSKI